jgi:cell division protein ZapB
MNLSKSQEIDKKDLKIITQQTKIDSVQAKLDVAIQELEIKKMQIANLGGDTTNFAQSIRNLINERDNLAKESKNNYNKYLSIKDKIQDALALKEEAELKVTRLETLLAKQDTVIYKMKMAINDKLDTINDLKLSRQQLAQKVAMASVLKAENINTVAISNKGKEKAGGEYRSKNLEKLRITFVLGENKVATKEGKDVYLRVIEPDGSALFDLATGGGSFMYNGKEIFYTMKQNALYSGNNQRLGFEYLKGSPFKVGINKIEVYCEGNLIGESTFVVR